MSSYFFRFFLLLFSSLSLPLFSQELEPIECRFLTLDEVPGLLLNVAGANKETEVKIQRNRITDPLKCFAVDGRLSFIDADTRKPVASIGVPANTPKLTLIFLKGESKGKEVWRIFPIKDSPSNFPAGGSHVVNLHSTDIRFILGEKKEVLKSGKSKGFEMPEKRDNFNMAPVVFQFKNKRDDWVNGKETSYRFLPAMRYLLVAYIDQRTKRPKVLTFKDLIRSKIPESSL